MNMDENNGGKRPESSETGVYAEPTDVKASGTGEDFVTSKDACTAIKDVDKSSTPESESKNVPTISEIVHKLEEPSKRDESFSRRWGKKENSEEESKEESLDPPKPLLFNKPDFSHRESYPELRVPTEQAVNRTKGKDRDCVKDLLEDSSKCTVVKSNVDLKLPSKDELEETAELEKKSSDISETSSDISEINADRSSASSSHHTRTKPGKNSTLNALLDAFFDSRKSEACEDKPESSKTEFTAENPKTCLSGETDNESKSSPNKSLESNKNRKFSEAFKVPAIPLRFSVSPRKSSEAQCSEETSKVKESAVVPACDQRRPTDFNVKARKAFYVFCPGMPGIMRQCQSLPNINRPHIQGRQRRSMNLELNPRLTQTIFSGNLNPDPSCIETNISTPDGATCPVCGTKTSTTDKLTKTGPKELSSDVKESSVSVSNIMYPKSNICRRLPFSSGPKKIESRALQKVESSQFTGSISSKQFHEVELMSDTETSGKAESSPKRKEISPLSVDCLISPFKKARIPSGENSKGANAVGKIENVPSVEKAGSDNVSKLHCTERKSQSPIKMEADEVDTLVVSNEIEMTDSKQPVDDVEKPECSRTKRTEDEIADSPLKSPGTI